MIAWYQSLDPKTTVIALCVLVAIAYAWLTHYLLTSEDGGRE